MKKFLEKLQQKSDLEKKVIAFNTALLLTLVIFALWAVSTFGSFGGTISSDVNQGVNSVKKQTATPISAIGDSFKNILNLGSELYESE